MILRTLAILVALAGFVLAGAPAHACDSNYPWTCKPVPSIDPPEAASEAKTTKPLQLTARRAAAASRKSNARAAKPTARATRAMAKVERASKASRQQAARKANARHLVLHARHAKVATREVEEEEARPAEAPRTAKLPVQRLNPARIADTTNEPSARFAAIWDERSTGAAKPAEAPQFNLASEPAPPPPAAPVQVASQNEVNELDLAAADKASDGSWLRSLFIAFGGLLAVGSALRLFV
jgi:hypothetical protein